MPVSLKIKESLTRSSWIRKMFEVGIELKKQYGEENVFDFSLGNPDIPSPAEFDVELLKEASKTGPFLHGYMLNNGYPETRLSVANALKKETNLPFTDDHIVMTCGAGGALNVMLKSLLNSNDEVIVVAPYFVEYNFYVENHGGVTVISQSTEDFLPDIQDIDKRITLKTRAIIINSPNNPTGRLYPSETLKELSDLLTIKSEEIGHPIYLLSDEPYKNIIYDGVGFPSPIKYYKWTIVIASFSKDLSLAGERIGYLAINPLIEDARDISNAATFCNRTLGFINAPALMQRVIKNVLDARVDVGIYQKRRDVLYDALTSMGYGIIKPEGTFYIFPKSPIEDDIEFVRTLQKWNILTTPGTGFHRPGYFRISFSVSERVINGSLKGFERSIRLYRGEKLNKGIL